MISIARLKRLAKGETVRLKASEVAEIMESVQLGVMNMKRLEKAYQSNKGLDLTLTKNEQKSLMAGHGFGEFMKKTGRVLNKVGKVAKDKRVRKGVKAGLKFGNEVMRRMGKDSIQKQVIDKGVNLARRLSRNEDFQNAVGTLGNMGMEAANSYIEGDGIGKDFKKFGRQLGKTAKKVGRDFKKVNNLSKKHTGMSITDVVADQAIDMLPIPKIAKDAIGFQVKKQVDKQMNGGSIANNPFIPDILKQKYAGQGFKNYGAGFKIGDEKFGRGLKRAAVYDDLKPILRPDQDGFAVSSDMLKKADGSSQRGSGFKSMNGGALQNNGIDRGLSSVLAPRPLGRGFKAV